MILDVRNFQYAHKCTDAHGDRVVEFFATCPGYQKHLNRVLLVSNVCWVHRYVSAGKGSKFHRHPWCTPSQSLQALVCSQGILWFKVKSCPEWLHVIFKADKTLLVI